MAATDGLEKQLDEWFGKKAPRLPEGGKKFIVDFAPWLTLLGGILSLWTAYNLWHWARTANDAINYLNNLSATYGGGTVPTSRLTTGIWLAVAVLVVEGVLYLLAFPKLRDRLKSGWNLIFYATLINIAYGLVVMFTDYGSVGSFIGSLIGAAIAFYFLFQVRPMYKGAAAPVKKD
jgi:hypothetical protein